MVQADKKQKGHIHLIVMVVIFALGVCSGFLNMTNYYILLIMLLNSILSIYYMVRKQHIVWNICQIVMSLGIAFLIFLTHASLIYMSHNIWVEIGKYMEMAAVYLMFLMALYNYNRVEHERKTGNEIVKMFAFNLFHATLATYIMELIYNTQPQAIPWCYLMYSVAILWVWFLGLTLVFNSFRLAGIFGIVICMLYSLTNYYVTLFRGIPLSVMDIKNVGTALNVAGGFKYNFTGESIIAISIVAGVVLFHLRSLQWKQKKRVLANKKLFLLQAGCMGLGILCMFGIFHLLIKKALLDRLEITLNAWDTQITYDEYGQTLTFLTLWEMSYLERPEGYSLSEVNTVYSRLELMETEDKTVSDTVRPKNIIVIMNEAFSDLSVLGDLQTNQDYMPFYHSLSENVVKGDCLVSVYGGGTCNSEYECLTGNSMWFTPSNYPYTDLLTAGQPSLVSTLESQGYTSFAIHPASGANWNRNRVYGYLGFDDFITLQEIESKEDLEHIRLYLSDKTLYQIVMETVDEKPGDTFAFVVTMQNHGGYDFEDYMADVQCENIDSDSLDQYLSLIHESDEALEMLIEHFQDSDEPTMIVMFGDHQPAIPDEVRGELMGSQEMSLEQMEGLYMTPYLIWTNYESETNLNELTSTNYLSTTILDRAGLELPLYNQYLWSMQQEIPAMNVWGYYDKDLQFHAYDEDSDIEEWLNDYSYLMYNQMIDRRNRKQGLFFIQD